MKSKKSKISSKKSTNQFTQKRFGIGSSPGLTPMIWGPLFWALLHDVAIVLDSHWSSWSPNQRTALNRIWYILKQVLPCKWCRESFRKFCRQSKPGYPFVDWVHMLHNKVNKKLEKPRLEKSKWLRRVQAYSSFGSTSSLWDLNFMLALNYDPQKKSKSYAKWFLYLETLIPYLVRDRQYDFNGLTELWSSLETLDFVPILKSKVTLLQWLTQTRNATLDPSHQRSVVEYVHQYKKAISHKTLKELELLCGPLITQVNENSE